MEDHTADFCVKSFVLMNCLSRVIHLGNRQSNILALTSSHVLAHSHSMAIFVIEGTGFWTLCAKMVHNYDIVALLLEKHQRP